MGLLLVVTERLGRRGVFSAAVMETSMRLML